MGDWALQAGEKGPDEHIVQAVMRSVLRGIEHIHRGHVVHCDLKPANVFIHITSEGGLVPKIGDFDVSRDKQGRTTWAATRASQSIAQQAGTPDYMAPELFTNQPASFASDMFSYGLMLHDLHSMSCSRPSGFGFASSGKAFPPLQHSNQALVALLRLLLDRDPRKRPTASEALAHDYFTASLLVEQKQLNDAMADAQQRNAKALEEQQRLDQDRDRLIMQEDKFKQDAANLVAEEESLKERMLALQLQVPEKQT